MTYLTGGDGARLLGADGALLTDGTDGTSPSVSPVGWIGGQIGRMLRRLPTPFDVDPEPFAALTVAYAGDWSWSVSEDTLSITIQNGPGLSATIDLTLFTLGQLATYLAVQPGFSLGAGPTIAQALLSATTLVPAAGAAAAGESVLLQGFQSLLWAYFSAAAAELRAARASIAGALQQMILTTASVEWLDMWGGMYGVLRSGGEADSDYAARIYATIFAPKCANAAISEAIQGVTGQPTVVVDAMNTDGSHAFSLFDVTVGFDILSTADPTAYEAAVIALVNQLRAAGTHLRSVLLSGSAVSDIAAGASSEVPAVSLINWNFFDGVHRCDGSIDFSGSSIANDSPRWS